MAVNRDKVKKQMAENKQRSGKFRYLPKDSTTALRIVEFEDEDGEVIFARQLVEHREVGSSSGKALGVCRQETFGEPCAFCAVNKKSKDAGGDWVYSSKRRFAVNAVDVNDSAPSMRIWMLPVTAYDQIAEFVMDEEYADVLEQKPGLAFGCKREGSGLDTEYTCKPQRKPWPVSAELMKQVTDPLESFADPGLEAQCETIGYELSDLFDDSELEPSDSGKKKGTKKDKAKTTTKSKKSGKGKEKELPVDEPTIEVGSAVLYEDEDVVYHVNSIDGDDIEIEDDDENVYEATLDQLKLVPDEEEPTVEDEESGETEEVDETITEGCEVTYLEEEDICTVKSIDGDDVVIEDGNGDQFDVSLEDLTYAGLPF